jgi:16S rRNA (guanine966-N2)-methyltransferase
MASVLAARGAIEGAVVLDLFAGTGALAFEMLSRGAASAVLVDHDRRALRHIERSARELGLDVAVVDHDLIGGAAAGRRRRPGTDSKRAFGIVNHPSIAMGAPFDLVLADPPYADAADAAELLAALARADRLAPDAFLVLEHATRTPPEIPPPLVSQASYRYGDTSFILARQQANSENA